jgi:hypothetical protein
MDPEAAEPEATAGMPTPSEWTSAMPQWREMAPPQERLKVRRPVLRWSAAAAVAAAAAGTLLVIASAGPQVPGAGMSPAAFVISSTQDTLGQHTADVVISGTVSAAGKVVPVQGTGQVDFAHDAFNGVLTIDKSGTSMVERELVVNRHLFMGLTLDGTDVSQITGGPHWIDIPIPDQSGSNAPGVGSVNPLTQIQMLARKGSTVVSLGTSDIDGTAVSGYAVTPSRLQVFEGIEREIASGQIPPSEVQNVLNASKALGTFTSDVWFDAAGLLRKQTVTISGGTSGIAGKVDLLYQNFGAPVDIQAPASGDVISFSQFTSDIQALGAAQA